MAESLIPPLPVVPQSLHAANERAVKAARAIAATFVHWTGIALQIVVAVAVLYMAATAVRIYARRYYIFLPAYVHDAFTAALVSTGRPTHVFFLFVDHFEPDWDASRAERWASRYRALAARHHDSAGRPPQHSWFYPGEQADAAILTVLQGLMKDGLGEVEFHYHHGGDTASTLAPKLREAIAQFQAFGFAKTIAGRTAFAFVHGNEDLDNADGEYCGVNNELQLLHELGCFADFTFPALYHASQPPSVNNIYAARDDDQPGSYRRVWPLAALKRGDADLMIFQGPIVLAPTWNLRRLFVEVDDGNVHAAMPANAERVRRWVSARVHVEPRPDWIFVKVFAHGVSTPEDEEELLGGNFDSALTALEIGYNDGLQYVLHYVTAREAYNLAMAAASGATGEPSKYFDSEIPPYVASVTRPGAPGLQNSPEPISRFRSP
jgi:hypothetical protein